MNTYDEKTHNTHETQANAATGTQRAQPFYSKRKVGGKHRLRTIR